MIGYHDTLHGFQVGRGTGTANLDTKLLQQLTALREAILHEVLLDLHKTYIALDRNRGLYILYGYGVVPRMLLILSTY